MNSTEWVKIWLETCDENGIPPWEFDFKQFYMNEMIKNDTSHLELWIKYKSKDLDSPQINLFTNNLKVTQDKENKDPDKLAFPIYDVLDWLSEKKCVVRGESMNSFKSTFTHDIVSTPEYKKIYRKIKIDLTEKLDKQYDKLLKNKNYLEFDIIRNNKISIEKFARLTHSIGNFIVIPYKLNLARGTSKEIRDYWDITLRVLYDLFMAIGIEGEEAWKAFINKYFLQTYVNKDYSVGELWKGHLEDKEGVFINGVYPQKIDDFEQFYRNVNLLIEERGKWMTKILCEKLDLTNLEFYKDDLVNMEKIRFFNDIIK